MKFASLLRRADTLRRLESDPIRESWWAGYMRGLRRAHHGENFGTLAEHELIELVSGEMNRKIIAGVEFEAVRLARRDIAVAELIEALGYCEAWFVRHSPTAELINGEHAEHPMLTCIRSAMDRYQELTE